MLRLYPNVKVEAQSFANVKIVTVPKQSMSLREIIKRFVRHESLPISQEGIYEENMGDLEKFAREDIFTKHERLDSARKRSKHIGSLLDAQTAAANAVPPANLSPNSGIIPSSVSNGFAGDGAGAAGKPV